MSGGNKCGKVKFDDIAKGESIVKETGMRTECCGAFPFSSKKVTEKSKE